MRRKVIFALWRAAMIALGLTAVFVFVDAPEWAKLGMCFLCGCLAEDTWRILGRAA